MTALDDHYTTLTTHKADKQEELDNQNKNNNINNRKAEYEADESSKVSIAGYYIGIVYYILWIISFAFFIHDKMYMSIWSTIWIFLMLCLPYMLYVYLIPYFIQLTDIILNRLIPTNAYYGITSQ
tara:strand:+ start:59 stop:433 length:375 start_codon:yes stop_codon:yes gene_type:complete